MSPAVTPPVATTLPPMALTPARTKRLRKAAEAAQGATEALNEEIRAAAAEGGSYREIAAEVGLSHTGVAYVVRGGRYSDG